MFKMFKKTKRFISFVLSFVMVCALFTGITVYSADLTEDGYESTSILNKSLVLTSDDSSRTKDDGSYDGYIQTLESFDYDYLRITYTVSGNVTDDTKVFTFQPFDTSWGGWQDNFATISASTLKDGVYTFTIPVEKIKQSLTTGTIKGINISFCPEIGASVTLTGYYGLKTVNDTPTEDDGNSEESAKIEPIIIKTITEEDLANEDCNWFGSNKVETYVKVTDATVYSWLNAVVSLGTDRAGKASSKYLHASKCTVKSGGNYIQDGIVGKAGTGNYAFPKVNLNTATSSGTELSADEQKKITIDIKTGTANTNCELLGFKFSNGAVYPKGFKPPTCESASLDITEAAEKDKLKLSLDYCDKMNSSKYTSDSWANFQTALATAKEKYNNSSLSSEEYASARADLEKVKANLVFIATTDKGNPTPFRVLSPQDMVSEMGVGWNLGNTMDGHSGFNPAETAWQPTVTTKEMIKSVHDLGINTVRIPVTWGTMIDEENGYTINEKWISRVQDIVDYCISLDMYAIINIHHDGAEQDGWLRVGAEDIDPVYEEFECVWRNIAERFKDYDEHLIFESMNEVTSGSNDASYVIYDNPIIMNMNQIFTNVVRSTGSNNAKRWLSVPGHYALTSAVTDTRYNFSIPTDTIDDRIFVAAHIYAGPSGFYMGQNMTSTVCDLSACSDMISKINALAKKWSKNGVPVIVGEYGCINKNNPTERAYYTEIFNRACKNAGMIVPCYWDQGWFDRTQKPADYSFSIIDRENCKPIDKEVTDGFIRGAYLSGDVSTLVKNPTINPITEINFDETNVSLTVGEDAVINTTVLPTDTNDVVVWASDDESIATVYKGKIRAKGIGKTTIKAISQSGSVSKDITVNVSANDNSTIANIDIEKDNYDFAVGEYAYIDVNILGENENDFLTFKSSDENIVSVSSIGKILAVSKGFATVTVTASSGITKVIKVTVGDVKVKDYIDLALNVLYNDSQVKYFGNEVGESVRITGEGQYTLSFDIDKDLSSAGQKANVTALKNLTAIYIKDLAVTNAEDMKSPLTTCKIKYDKVLVDGNEMTITKTDEKEAINASGIFDTGDPINGYDGCAIDGVSVSSNTCNFKDYPKAKKIEVTFTLSDLKFIEPKADDTVFAESITTSKKDVVISEVGAEQEISVSVLPKNVNSKVSFVSSDISIVDVLNNSVMVDPETGIATVKIKAIKEGNTTVLAYIDNLTPVIFNVTTGKVISKIDGDADGDGVLSVDDASLILQYVLKKENVDSSCYDVDKNKFIDSRDSAMVLVKALETK